MAFEKGSDFAAELKEGEEIGDAGRVNAGGRWRFMRPLSPYEGERGITNQRIRTQGGGPCGTSGGRLAWSGVRVCGIKLLP